jgi:hypothetical protein
MTEHAARLDALAATASAAHERAQAAARSSAGYARECGEALANAKSLLPHGQWLPWLRQHVPTVSERLAQYYMRVARRWDELQAANPNAGSDLSYHDAIDLLAEPIDSRAEPRPALTLAPGGHEGDPDLAPADAPLVAGKLTMIRLMFGQSDGAMFVEQVRALGAVYGTSTTSDTIARVVSVAHAAIAGSQWCRRSA